MNALARRHHRRPGAGPGGPHVGRRARRLGGAGLRGFGRLSAFCCPGWVADDGTVQDSRLVNPEEWGALDAAVAEGLADLECHGYTHLDPDLDAWRAAADRHDDEAWYRELWPP